jgi:hypothetical protein
LFPKLFGANAVNGARAFYLFFYLIFDATARVKSVCVGFCVVPGDVVKINLYFWKMS